MKITRKFNVGTHVQYIDISGDRKFFPFRYNPDKLLTCIDYCGKYLGAKNSYRK